MIKYSRQLVPDQEIEIVSAWVNMRMADNLVHPLAVVINVTVGQKVVANSRRNREGTLATLSLYDPDGCLVFEMASCVSTPDVDLDPDSDLYLLSQKAELI